MIRSSFEGSESRPTRVNVELAAVLGNGLNDDMAQTRVRVDVQREEDRWLVVDFGGPSFTGYFVTRDAQVKTHLDGTGWRLLGE